MLHPASILHDGMFRWGIYTNSVGNKEQMKDTGGFPGSASGKEPACPCRRYKRHGLDPWVGKIPLVEEMATHSSVLAWRIPWTEETGGLKFMGLQRVRYD